MVSRAVLLRVLSHQNSRFEARMLEDVVSAINSRISLGGSIEVLDAAEVHI